MQAGVSRGLRLAPYFWNLARFEAENPEDCVSRAGRIGDFLKNSSHFSADYVSHPWPVQRSVRPSNLGPHALGGQLRTVTLPELGARLPMTLALAGGSRADPLPLAGPWRRAEPLAAHPAPPGLRHRRLQGEAFAGEAGVDYFT